MYFSSKKISYGMFDGNVYTFINFHFHKIVIIILLLLLLMWLLCGSFDAPQQRSTAIKSNLSIRWITMAMMEGKCWLSPSAATPWVPLFRWWWLFVVGWFPLVSLFVDVRSCCCCWSTGIHWLFIGIWFMLFEKNYSISENLPLFSRQVASYWR